MKHTNPVLNDDETLALVVAYLAKRQPGFLPPALFAQFARLSTLATLELVPFRTTPQGEVEVLLTQRAADDAWWPGEWHVPGTTIRANDRADNIRDYRDTFARILGADGELKGGVRALADPIEVQTEHRQTERGPELSIAFFVEVAGEPDPQVATYVPLAGFPASAPGKVIEHHVPFILDARDAYVRWRDGGRPKPGAVS